VPVTSVAVPAHPGDYGAQARFALFQNAGVMRWLPMLPKRNLDRRQKWTAIEEMTEPRMLVIAGIT